MRVSPAFGRIYYYTDLIPLGHAQDRTAVSVMRQFCQLARADFPEANLEDRDQFLITFTSDRKGTRHRLIGLTQPELGEFWTHFQTQLTKPRPVAGGAKKKKKGGGKHAGGVKLRPWYNEAGARQEIATIKSKKELYQALWAMFNQERKENCAKAAADELVRAHHSQLTQFGPSMN